MRLAALLPLVLALSLAGLSPMAPALAQQTDDPSGGFRLDPAPAPSPGPVVAPLPIPIPTPSATPAVRPTEVQPPVTTPRTATPRSATPRTSAPRPQTSATPRPRPTSTPRPTPTPLATAQTGPATTSESAEATSVAPDPLPTPEPAPLQPVPSIADTTTAEPTISAPAEAEGQRPLWPWIAGLIALIAGAAFWWLRRDTGTPAGNTTDTAPAALAPPSDPPAPSPTGPPARLPDADSDAVPADTVADSAPAAGNLPKGVVTSGASKAASPATGGTVRAFSGLTGTPPLPVPPTPTPAPPAARGGFVTTRMANMPGAGRAQLGMTLEVLGAEQNETQFILYYRLWVTNEGPGAAEGGRLRLNILPGGQDTQGQVDRFFAGPSADGQTVDLPPMGQASRTPVEGEMRVALDPAITFRMNNRQVIIPLVAAELHYSWPGGEDAHQASFVIGREGGAGQDRLGPIAIDQGPRSIGGIASKAV